MRETLLVQVTADGHLARRNLVEVSDDVVGVELGGFLKNVVAILAGVAEGLTGSMNTKAVVVTQGFYEISLVATKLGAKKETMLGLAGMGDLLVSCFSPVTRNNRFGQQLALGKSVDEAKEIIGQVCEGFPATKVAFTIAQKHNLDTPLIKKLYPVLYEGAAIKKDFFSD